MAKNKLNLGSLLESVTDRVEEANMEQDAPVQEDVRIVEKLMPDVKVESIAPASETRKGPKSGTVGKGHVINANLDDEIYWRADIVKKRLNKERVGDAPFVSINTMLCDALTQWLDTNYPETKQQYQKAIELGIL